MTLDHEGLQKSLLRLPTIELEFRGEAFSDACCFGFRGRLGTGASLQTKIRSLRRDDGSQSRRSCVVMRGAAFAVRYAAVTRGSFRRASV
jgi:hypothetical protein